MALSAAQTWPASVELGLRSESGRTRLARCSHNGPLYVQRPFYPEGREHPHLYLLHPPGGIVSGDCLDIEVDVAANSGALVTTPGATRVYRARDDNPLQRQRCRLRLGKDAILEWFPMETIVFDGAWVELETTVELTRNSCFVGWEVSCFGLPASRQPFVADVFHSVTVCCRRERRYSSRTSPWMKTIASRCCTVRQGCVVNLLPAFFWPDPLLPKNTLPCCNYCARLRRDLTWQ